MGRWVWMGVGRLYPPVRYDIVSSNLYVLIAQNLLLTGVTSSLNLREIPSAPTYSSLYFYSKFDLEV